MSIPTPLPSPLGAVTTLANLSSPDCLYYPFSFCGAWSFPAPVGLELRSCLVQWVLYPSRGQDLPTKRVVLTVPLGHC